MGLIVAVYVGGYTVKLTLAVRFNPLSPVILNVSEYTPARRLFLGLTLTVAVPDGLIVVELSAVLISKLESFVSEALSPVNAPVLVIVNCCAVCVGYPKVADGNVWLVGSIVAV